MVSVSFCSVHIDCTDVYKPSLNYNDGPHVLYLCGVFWFYVLLFYVMCCFSIVNYGWIMMSEWASEWVSGMLIWCCCRSTVWQVTAISWLRNCLHSMLCVSLRLSVCLSVCSLYQSLSLSLSATVILYSQAPNLTLTGVSIYTISRCAKIVILEATGVDLICHEW